MIDLENAELLARTDHHRILRAHRDDETVVVVKQLVADAGNGADLERLGNEFTFTRLLGDTLPRQALAATLVDGRPALLFSDPGGTPLATAARDASLSERLELAVATTRALSRLHALGITHGDVATDNVLVLPDGEALLIDLELATLETYRVVEASHPTELAATLTALPPENSGRLRRCSDRRADLYGLGATLFEIVAGRPPFVEGDALGLVQSHIARAPPSLLELSAEIPTALARVVATLLAKRPEDRYQDVAAVLADLERITERAAAGALQQRSRSGGRHASAALRTPHGAHRPS